MNDRDDRIRQHTAPAVQQRIDDRTVGSLMHCATGDATLVAERLRELEREWDTDRAIGLEAAMTGLIGLALGTFLRPALRLVPAVVACALLAHAITGRYPLLPLLRRLGLRTAREIARERYALKALRGDFAEPGRSVPERTEPDRAGPDVRSGERRTDAGSVPTAPLHGAPGLAAVPAARP